MKNKHVIGHLSIDFGDCKIESNGIDVSIDLKAVEVLEMLVHSSGQTVTIVSFMEKVWANKPSSPEVVTSAIARLRKLFKMTGIGEDVIVTVHKVGYRFQEPTKLMANTASYPLRKWLSLLLLMGLILSIGVNIKQYLDEAKELDLSQAKLATITRESQAHVTQIFILRHAEKSSANQEDPTLSELGIKHANYWKTVLQHIDFDRVFTTSFTRNMQTAEVISTDLNIKPEIYYPMSFEVLKFVQEIQGQKVLIIGHSNTIPDMVNRLIDETKYPPMSHKNYNLMYLITINKNGDTSSSLMHIEMPDNKQL
ncbi:MAG: winged helix-turn-helix domain-containing protein [Proteobacteria bacterium]|nr:winged helix-turn-helix domain-containing protein [Pseudomonadota bacterium]